MAESVSSLVEAATLGLRNLAVYAASIESDLAERERGVKSRTERLTKELSALTKRYDELSEEKVLLERTIQTLKDENSSLTAWKQEVEKDPRWQKDRAARLLKEREALASRLETLDKELNGT